MILLIWLIVILLALVLYYRQKYSYFSKRGVRTLRPIPPMGNISSMFTRQTHMVEFFNDVYKAFPEDRFVGLYEFARPMLLVRDLELIKLITVKDFEYFIDHRNAINEDTDELFSKSLFLLKGQKWKDMRATMSPMFTSSKIRHMLPFILEVGEQTMTVIGNKIKDSKDGRIDIDCKDLANRFANDVIATCAFGLVVDSQVNPDNQFYKLGMMINDFGGLRQLKLMLAVWLPKVAKMLKISFFPKFMNTFFRDLVRSTIEEREKLHIHRPDMIHLFMEAKKGKLTREEATDADTGFATVQESTLKNTRLKTVWTDDDLTAQAMLFFFAGFETVATAMTFLVYELAVNPDVQEKLAQEVKKHDAKTGGKFDYTSIQEMKYMDMVVSESLRLWPPAAVTDRLCVKEYSIGKPNKETTSDYNVAKGESISIPIWAFHRDPQYFPEPLKFAPERFSDENKHNIKPFSYMPFGLGPRNCIASRFALCEVKAMAYVLLKHMVVSPCEKTTIPAVLDTKNFNLRLKGGHHVRLTLRH